MAGLPRLLFLLCGATVGCSTPTRPFTPPSRAWNPNFAPGECRAHRVSVRRTTSSGRITNHRYWVCDELPIPSFTVVSTHPLVGGRNLMGADLAHVDLSEARLAYANLNEANLMSATLFEADLFRARLRGADLTHADLTRADLTDADLSRAKLFGTNLALADLEGSNLARATIVGVEWTATTCPDGTLSDRDGGTCAGHLAPKLPGARGIVNREPRLPDSG